MHRESSEHASLRDLHIFVQTFYWQSSATTVMPSGGIPENHTLADYM